MGWVKELATCRYNKIHLSLFCFSLLHGQCQFSMSHVSSTSAYTGSHKQDRHLLECIV